MWGKRFFGFGSTYAVENDVERLDGRPNVKATVLHFSQQPFSPFGGDFVARQTILLLDSADASPSF